ncbi:MAG: DUF1987 domain-containing protein [Cyclobacteriaceae bacterium]|nr:DUF1987 domain-containing protein [Cyclobacteriaceae bacterium]MCH8515809.1 DUF1987 domain-containing protein [Cyclobacteriaceae bacterium]
MDPLEIPAKEASPFIKFDPAGTLEIRGKSFDEEVVSIYAMVLRKIHEYGNTGNDHLNVNFFLKYFNTASSKCLFDLLNALKDLQDKKNITIKMKWSYQEEDEAMKEEIEEFKEEIDLDFEITPEEGFYR